MGQNFRGAETTAACPRDESFSVARHRPTVSRYTPNVYRLFFKPEASLRFESILFSDGVPSEKNQSATRRAFGPTLAD